MSQRKGVLSRIRKKAETSLVWRAFLDKYTFEGCQCFYCDTLLNHTRKSSTYIGNQMTADHIVPRSKGGTITVKNIVVCCQDCNKAKSDREFIEFGISIILIKAFCAADKSALPLEYGTLSDGVGTTPLLPAISCDSTPPPDDHYES